MNEKRDAAFNTTGLPGRRLRVLTSILLLGIVGFIAWFFIKRHWGEFVTLVDLSPGYLVQMSILIVLFQTVLGVKIRAATRAFDVHLAGHQWFAVAQINSLLNYLPVRSGPIVSAAYLKNVFDFPYTRYASVLGAGFVLTVIVFSSMGCLGIIGMAILGEAMLWEILPIYAVMIAAPLGLFLWMGRNPESIQNRLLVRFREGWAVIAGNAMCLGTLIVADCLLVMIDSYRILLSYRTVGVDIPYLAGWAMIPLANLAGVLSFVPGGLGVKEGVVGLLSRVAGIGFESGIYATGIDRVLLMMWLVILGVASMLTLVLRHGIFHEKS
ncbi:MAG: flippase-like domain-containing protein [Deltaproteobacteria bacterium]|nr:flippase-like domain-containing protein [Candidatus Zymogenaceae bacterium]